MISPLFKFIMDKFHSCKEGLTIIKQRFKILTMSKWANAGDMSQNFRGNFDPLPGVFRTWDHHHCLTNPILQISKKNGQGPPCPGEHCPRSAAYAGITSWHLWVVPQEPQVVIRYTFLHLQLPTSTSTSSCCHIHRENLTSM